MEADDEAMQDLGALALPKPQERKTAPAPAE
jgi:hypothetical protein